MCDVFRTGSRSSDPRPPDRGPGRAAWARPVKVSSGQTAGTGRVLRLTAAHEGAVLPLPGDLLLLVGAAGGHRGRGVAEQRGGDDAVTHREVADAHLLDGVHQGRDDPWCGPASLCQDVDAAGRGARSGRAVDHRDGFRTAVAVQVAGGLLGHGMARPAAFQGEGRTGRVGGGDGRRAVLRRGAVRGGGGRGARVGLEQTGCRDDRCHGRRRGEPVHRRGVGVREVRERGGLHAGCLLWSCGAECRKRRCRRRDVGGGVGVASIVPHLTRQWNGGVATDPVLRSSPAQGQRKGAAAEFPGRSGNSAAAPAMPGRMSRTAPLVQSRSEPLWLPGPV